MNTSRRMAGLIGPTMIALGITEALNLRTMLENPASVVLVYMNGTLLFVAGVAIIRDHNRWVTGWPVLITITGWLLVVGGLLRMTAPLRVQSEVRASWTYGLLTVIVCAGALLTYKAYRPREAGRE